MRARILVPACFLIFAGAAAVQAQQIQVSRENRTIAVSATDTVEAAPGIAVVSIGYHNYGKTHDEAYDDNVRAADKIVNALLAAGVPKENIQTDSLNLAPVESPDRNWTAQQKQDRQFEATQIWNLRLPATSAQKFVDIAIRAGANQLQNIDWQVVDPKALEAKAGAAALAKARSIADAMASHLGTKLGELIYASNQTPVSRFLTLNTTEASLGAARLFLLRRRI